MLNESCKAWALSCSNIAMIVANLEVPSWTGKWVGGGRVKIFIVKLRLRRSILSLPEKIILFYYIVDGLPAFFGALLKAIEVREAHEASGEGQQGLLKLTLVEQRFSSESYF